MRHAFIDRHSRLSSPIHRVSVPLKLSVTIVLLFSIVMVPISARTFFISIAMVLSLIAWLSRIPPLFLLKRLLFLEIFVIGMAVLSLFQPDGIAVFVRVLAKSTLCLFTIVLFSNTTRFAMLLGSLRHWGVPDLMVTILALMYRYIFVMIDERERMQRARTSRTFAEQRWAQWTSLSTVVVQLFIRSTERAERIYAAMCARGWK